MTSVCRQNYHEESEAGVNKQINLELYASYVYMSMVCFNHCRSNPLSGSVDGCFYRTDRGSFINFRPTTLIVMMWPSQDSISSWRKTLTRSVNTQWRFVCHLTCVCVWLWTLDSEWGGFPCRATIICLNFKATVSLKVLISIHSSWSSRTSAEVALCFRISRYNSHSCIRVKSDIECIKMWLRSHYLHWVLNRDFKVMSFLNPKVGSAVYKRLSR